MAIRLVKKYYVALWQSLTAHKSHGTIRGMSKENKGGSKDKEFKWKKLSKKERARRASRFDKEQPKTDAFKEILIARDDFDDMYPRQEGDSTAASESVDEDYDNEIFDPTRSSVGIYDALLAARPDTSLPPANTDGTTLISEAVISIKDPLLPHERELFSNLAPLFHKGNEQPITIAEPIAVLKA